MLRLCADVQKGPICLKDGPHWKVPWRAAAVMSGLLRASTKIAGPKPGKVCFSEGLLFQSSTGRKGS